MARRKIPISLIAHRQKRAATFAKRKESLKKKAEELSTLCGVRVALVCAGTGVPGGGAVSKEVWESEEGVLTEYRALPPEVRAQHTHRIYLEEELGKERAKLARVRQDGAFTSWDAALDGITVDEARALLESIDAARAAASARREALGLLDDGNGVDDDGGFALQLQQQHIPPGASHAVVVPVGHGVQYIGSSGGSNQMQATPAADGINCADPYDAVPWDNTFQPHLMRTGDHCVPMYSYLWQAPDGNGWPDLATGCTDESCSCNAAAAAAAAVPAMYAPSLDTVHGSFLSGPAQPVAFSTGADFINAPNDFLTMGLGGGFTNVGDYSAQSSADGFQLGDMFGAEPGDTQSQNWPIGGASSTSSATIRRNETAAPSSILIR
uniref:MADS-box domain-containing protein n=1 Tax=Oryza punctata TaxID=4537 RepID=A0A0E0JI16_ORYPU